MLVVPFAAGTILCWRSGGLPTHVAPMFATWMLGYFAFHSASGWLKSPPARRHRWLPALAVYGAGTATAGLVTVWLSGPPVLWWLALYAPLLGVALWLASRRQERHLLGGLLTTFLASGMVLVVRFPDPTTMPTYPAFPQTGILAALVFGYFGGTVLHVKAMIRRRGELAWRNTSIAWHTAWTLLAAALVVFGRLSPAWPMFFLATTVRAWLLPMAGERWRVRPWMIGLVEIALSLSSLAIIATTGSVT